MAIALVASSSEPSADGNDVTSDPAIDTTGANLIVIGVVLSQSSTATIEDNKSNTYTALTLTENSGIRTRLYYALNPTVGAGHTFTVQGDADFPGIWVHAYSGVATSDAFDVEDGNTDGGGTTVNAGATGVTPTTDGQLIVTVIGLDSNLDTTYSIGSSFTIEGGQFREGGNNWGGAMAYLIQSSAGAINPQWSADGAWGVACTRIATFKAADGGGGGMTLGPMFGG